MDGLNILMKDISIEFPGVKALDLARFEINSGEVHSLIGANGAGKSTIMNVLTGKHNHWTGKIFLNEEEISIRSVLDAKSYGIEMVHQEVDTALVPYLSVAENIMIDYMVQEMDKNHFINWNYIRSESKNILNNLNLEISVDEPVQNCTLAEKQMILIARSVSRDCKVLVLDEPTAPLSDNETKHLFEIVNDLKKNGVAIVFISHRLPEIFEISDKITIMRDGKFIVEKDIDEINEKEIIDHMLGKSMEDNYPKYDVEIGPTALELVSVNDGKFLSNINMEVKKSEIVGVAGLVGAGKTELTKVLFGAEPISEGKILINGKEVVINNPVEAVKNKIALIPEERRKEGIVIEEPVSSNLTLSSLGKFTKNSFISIEEEKRVSKEIIQKLGIKTPSEKQKVKNLSGGNQQKVVIGKWLISDADIYVFDEPTKGVDVGSKRDIFELIGELVKAGKSVIYASCENTELLNITDRIYVMYSGRIVKELDTTETNEQEILYYSAGGNNYER